MAHVHHTLVITVDSSKYALLQSVHHTKGSSSDQATLEIRSPGYYSTSTYMPNPEGNLFNLVHSGSSSRRITSSNQLKRADDGLYVLHLTTDLTLSILEGCHCHAFDD